MGARRIAEEPMDEARRQELVERLASHFEHPETAPWDWEALRVGKQLAWPQR